MSSIGSAPPPTETAGERHVVLIPGFFGFACLCWPSSPLSLPFPTRWRAG